MALETTIQDKLVKRLIQLFFQQKESSFEVAADKITSDYFLKNDPTLRFHFLTDLCGIHYPDNDVDQQFAVVYHLHNWYENKRIKSKLYNGENQK
jgi:NADH-quinone oxidoreductase subunit C